MKKGGGQMRRLSSVVFDQYAGIRPGDGARDADGGDESSERTATEGRDVEKGVATDRDVEKGGA